MAFNDENTFLTTEELSACASADHVYEAIRDYIAAHPNFRYRDVVGLLTGLPYNDVYKVVIFLFKDGLDIRSVLDKLKDILWALERDNNLIGGK